jgi:hypothetical protein
MRPFAQSALVDEYDGPPLHQGFLNPRPLHFLPAGNPLLVAFNRPPAGTLAAPVKPTQQAPHLRGVVSDCALLFDQLRHLAKRRQSSGIIRTAQLPAADSARRVAALLSLSLGGRPRPCCPPQPLPSGLGQRLCPAVD